VDSSRPDASKSLLPPPSPAQRREASSEPPSPWLNYQAAAVYCSWTVGHLRNLVSAGRIPVYGKPRMRRFHRDMLDLFLTDPDAALRKFRSERNTHGG
jgi:hypothetical protein